MATFEKWYVRVVSQNVKMFNFLLFSFKLIKNSFFKFQIHCLWRYLIENMEAFFRVSYVKIFCIALFFLIKSLHFFLHFLCEPRHYLWIKLMRLQEKRADFFFYLLFGCPMVNLGQLLRKQPH